ncbi:hypothetical protein ISN45_At03g000850 [Arabidopsis thaliana x Arabidopsis arenosa]|uniref:Uncharacterized protein n=2 Tax=Arabidopsis TaxID=3701 RepID=A0A8T2F202_ARASU|nr:hypothetical protein ISN45_At03g000850 [Arabidopsis thaliana x Arabidopsis arenosa]KAG7629649.1 hypothetical protein ISN44_As03g000780 [Arabidopsis suecica]
MFNSDYKGIIDFSCITAPPPDTKVLFVHLVGIIGFGW